jgi:hypothetical protein
MTARPERGDVLLWVAVLAGPLAWALTELLSYGIAPTACWSRNKLMLHLVPLGALLIVAAGAAIAWRRLDGEPAGSTEKGDFQESRRRFMAAAGFWLCLAFALAILATAIPPMILRVCD